MNEDIEALRRDYRAVTAPPQLRRRIHARVAAPRRHHPRWLPALGLAAAALAAAWVLTLVPRHEAGPPASPSLSALASLAPERPPGTAPSLTRMKTVSLPAPPRRPEPTEPSTKNDTDSTKEKHHA